MLRAVRLLAVLTQYQSVRRTDTARQTVLVNHMALCVHE